MTTRATMRPGDGDSRHGTRNGYVNLRCRCEDCRSANTETLTRWRAAARARAPKMVLSHGSRSTYTNWSCRCEDCRAAETAAKAAARDRTKR